jgi:hypothetical protein
MGNKEALKKLVAALGGKSEAETTVGLLGEISAALGGKADGKTIAEQIDNIAKVAKKPAEVELGD